MDRDAKVKLAKKVIAKFQTKGMYPRWRVSDKMSDPYRASQAGLPLRTPMPAPLVYVQAHARTLLTPYESEQVLVKMKEALNAAGFQCMLFARYGQQPSLNVLVDDASKVANWKPNPHYAADFIAPDTAKVVKLFSKSGFTDIHMKKLANPTRRVWKVEFHPATGQTARLRQIVERWSGKLNTTTFVATFAAADDAENATEQAADWGIAGRDTRRAKPKVALVRRNPKVALRWVRHHPHLGEKRPYYSAAAQGGAFKITPFPMGGWTVKWADATHEARVGNFSTLPLAKAAAARAEVTPKRNPAKAGDLYDYHTGEFIRRATPAEYRASVEAAKYDGGAGVISVNGRSCYVITARKGGAKKRNPKKTKNPRKAPYAIGTVGIAYTPPAGPRYAGDTTYARGTWRVVTPDGKNAFSVFDSPTGYPRQGGSGKGAVINRAYQLMGFRKLSDREMRDLLRAAPANFVPHEFKRTGHEASTDPRKH